MTEHFSQQRIDEIRECFDLYSDAGFIRSSSQLRCVLRSLGYAPTLEKVAEHYRAYRKKHIDFAAFLQIAAIEAQSGDPLVEVIRALKALSPEIDAVLAQVEVNGFVPHQKLVQLISRQATHF